MRRILLYGKLSELLNAAALGIANAAVSLEQKDFTITKAINIRDTFLYPEEFAKLSLEEKAEALSLQNEQSKSGYVDVRTAMGPDQWFRVTKKQRSQIEKNMLSTFSREDRLRELKKSPAQRSEERKNKLLKKINGRMLQINNQIKWLESVESKKLNSRRSNSTKVAYKVITNELKSLEKAKRKL